ncbi:MAG: ABC transporter permease [Sulfolobales archaeon]
MWRYLLSRLIQSFFIILVVIVINFFIISLAPGDPVRFIAGDLSLYSPEVAEYLRARWGLDKPLYERLAIYIYNVMRGDLGYSYRYSAPVAELIIERLPTTLLLTITANLLAFVLGVYAGVLAARRVGGRIDTALNLLNFFLWSTPSFWLGIVLMLLFGVYLRILPVAGLMDVRNPQTGFMLYLDIARHSILPITTLTLITLPLYYKIVRDTMIQQASEDYVITYRAIGYSEGEIYRRFVFRNSIIPPVTVFAIHMGFAVAGAALIENVFGWPGVGRLLLDSIASRDYPIILGVYLVISITVVLANLIVDLLYAYLDPRVRIGRRS